MKVLYGPMCSGKTGRLFSLYQEWCTSGVKTGEIMVLVFNAASVLDWRKRLNLPAAGNLNISTYFGLVHREVMRFWPLIDKHLPGGAACAQPTFMTVETAHYLMGLLVEELRGQGYFPEVSATSQQIAVQMIDNLNQTAMNGYQLAEGGERLMLSVGDGNHKQKALSQAVETMQAFRRNCLQSRCLDYSLTVELFNRYLLPDPDYFAKLSGSVRYLLVDNLEESVPVAQDLIHKLLPFTRQACLAFDPHGGYSDFFGADKSRAEIMFLADADIEYLSAGVSPEVAGFAESLAACISKTGSTPTSRHAGVLKGQISTQLRGEMLKDVSKQIIALIEDGLKPEEIAIISPDVDQVVEFTLGRDLTAKSIGLANLNRDKRLLDQGFAQALIYLAILVYPEWHLELNFSGLVQALSILLQVDPIRAALLAEEIVRHSLDLPALDAVGLRLRLGFDNSEKYELLRAWILQKRVEKPELDLLFQQVFGELLAPLRPGEQDLLACRQVINSITKFTTVIKNFQGFGQDDISRRFLDMVTRGTLAAETLFRPPAHAGKVLLATPYIFLLSPWIKKVKYQFWLDVSSEQWLRGGAKELTNPYVMSRSWNPELTWDDQTDQDRRIARLSRIVLGLLGKCSHGLYTAACYLNPQGYEQNSYLAQCLEELGGEEFA